MTRLVQSTFLVSLLLGGCSGEGDSGNPVDRQRQVRDQIELTHDVPYGYKASSEYLEDLRRMASEWAVGELRSAVDAVARGESCTATVAASAVLCEMDGLGDPLDVGRGLWAKCAYRGGEISEPQWFAHVAISLLEDARGKGFAFCFVGPSDEMFADRRRAYEAIGATEAARVMQEADQLFGEGGPPAVASERELACTGEVHVSLQALQKRFWGCEDEILTQVHLHFIAHADHFRDLGSR